MDLSGGIGKRGSLFNGKVAACGTGGRSTLDPRLPFSLKMLHHMPELLNDEFPVGICQSAQGVFEVPAYAGLIDFPLPAKQIGYIHAESIGQSDERSKRRYPSGYLETAHEIEADSCEISKSLLCQVQYLPPLLDPPREGPEQSFQAAFFHA